MVQYPGVQVYNKYVFNGSEEPFDFTLAGTFLLFIIMIIKIRSSPSAESGKLLCLPTT